MDDKNLAEELLQKDVAAKKRDNTAANSGNSGTVRIGRGSDESCTINVNITESSISVVNTTGEGRHTVNTQPKRPKKKSACKADVSKTKRCVSILTVLAAFLSGLLILEVIKKNAKIDNNN